MFYQQTNAVSYCDHISFYLPPADNPHIHSFPTRRSSDLGETPKPGPQIDRQTSCPEGGPTTLKEMVSEKDRKSTRLNSSHRCISYAVFCLKKKKREQADKLGGLRNR